MRISKMPGVSSGKTRCCHGAPWRWTMPLLVYAVCALQGCANPPAPSPVPNPHPQNFVKLKITVEKGSEVNRIEVQSLWVVTRLDCAPIVYPEGYRHVKQVDVSEDVEKVGNIYVATLIMDRFMPDKCRWTNGGPGIRFFHDSYLLTVDGVNDNVLHGATHKMTCLTRPSVEVGVCGTRDEESLYKREDKHAFNVTVEVMP